jgi:hypothetical protein
VQRLIANPAYAGERYGVSRAHKPIISRRLSPGAAAGERRAVGVGCERGFVNLVSEGWALCDRLQPDLPQSAPGNILRLLS